ncbi:MAG: OsmC family protein [Polyangiales bacterium]
MPELQPAGRFSIRVQQIDGHEFRVSFDKSHYTELRMDEPTPLGHDAGPNAARILASSIAVCLSSSLLFCLKRGGVPVEDLRTEADVELGRNEDKRLRIRSIAVRIAPQVGGDPGALEKCIATFEDFCVVTQSVREGIDVSVEVQPIPVSGVEVTS